MCDLCTTVIADMSPRTAAQCSALVKALLNHFVEETENGTEFNKDKLFAALSPFIGGSELRDMLPTSKAALHIFLHGAMCALDLITTSVDHAHLKVRSELASDLDIITEALNQP